MSSGLSGACGEGKLMGVAALSEKMKSSRFMASDWDMLFSDDFRNWAMPLGALCIMERPSLEAHVSTSWLMDLHASD